MLTIMNVIKAYERFNPLAGILVFEA